jgi:hypothetical protein
MSSNTQVIVRLDEARLDPELDSILWWVSGRIISVIAQAPAERALIGCPVSIRVAQTQKPRVRLQPGFLIRTELPLITVNNALDSIASETPDFTIKLTDTIIEPMSEPSIRIPLSLLRELRGQEWQTEQSRRVLCDLPFNKYKF